MTTSRALRLAAIPLLLCLSSMSHAGFTVYTTQAAFNAATTAPGVDTYTGLSITGSTPSPLIRTAGAYGYTATASTTTFFGAGTTANPWLSTNTATDTITFNNFLGGAQAIGGNFFGSDISGLFANGNVVITAVDNTGTSVQTITNAAVTSFLGFVSSGTLISLSVSAVQPTASFLWPTVDNLTLARVAANGTVPEPASMAMLLSGLGIMAMLARRRRV